MALEIKGYPGEEAICPHGISVIIDAPSVFRFTAPTSPARHLEAATLLGGDTNGAGEENAGEALAGSIIAMMRDTGMPNGIAALGYFVGPDPGGTTTVETNSPVPVDEDDLLTLYRGAAAYW